MRDEQLLNQIYFENWNEANGKMLEAKYMVRVIFAFISLYQ